MQGLRYFRVKRRRSKRKQIKNFGGSIWSVYSMFMLQGVAFSNRGVGRALKYSGFAFILSLMITSAYSGGLASVMTVPRYVMYQGGTKTHCTIYLKISNLRYLPTKALSPRLHKWLINVFQICRCYRNSRRSR